MAIFGGYTLQLTCDVEPCNALRHSLGEFKGPSESDCMRQARVVGWRIQRRYGAGKDRVVCPVCIEKGIILTDLIPRNNTT